MCSDYCNEPDAVCLQSIHSLAAEADMYVISVKEVSATSLNILRTEKRDGFKSAWRWTGAEIRENLTGR